MSQMNEEKQTAISENGERRAAVRALKQQMATVSRGSLKSVESVKSSKERAGGGARASSRTSDHGPSILSQ